MAQSTIRTDLAMEARESLTHTPHEDSGIEVTEDILSPGTIKQTTVKITTENASASIGKPKGTYITLESGEMDLDDTQHHMCISQALSRILLRFIAPQKEPVSILVVGLGNRNVTPDALGPNVIDQLHITRHLYNEFGNAAFSTPCKYLISSIIPGVMGQTGMETSEIIKGIVKETNPDYVIVIDALAARSTKRLNRTIQISDTGIHPGSGVGNHRNALTKESLGRPVIAIGIPTVVDAATIVADSLFLEQGDELLEEVLVPGLRTMFVTPKDIDASVHRLSHIISDGLNRAFRIPFADNPLSNGQLLG